MEKRKIVNESKTGLYRILLQSNYSEISKVSLTMNSYATIYKLPTLFTTTMIFNKLVRSIFNDYLIKLKTTAFIGL